MDELQKKKLDDIKKWAGSAATCFEKQMQPEEARDLDRFTDFFKGLSEDHKLLQAKTPSIVRKAREFSPEMEAGVKATETDMQGIIVILGELIKYLTFFRRKISRGTESSKVRAFIGAASEKHDALKEKAEAIIGMVDKLDPPEEAPEASEGECEAGEEDSGPSDEFNSEEDKA